MGRSLMRARRLWILVLGSVIGCAGTSERLPRGGAAATPQTTQDSASFDRIATEVRDHYCMTAEGEIALSGPASCDDITMVLDAVPGASTSLDARLVHLSIPDVAVHVLLVRAGGRTRAFFLDELSQSSDDDSTIETEALARTLRITGDELVLELATRRTETASHGCTVTESSRLRTILCRATPAGPECADVPTAYASRRECDDFCLVRQLAEDDASCESEHTPDREEGYELALDLRGETIAVLAVRSVDAAPPAGLVGEHTTSELFVLRAMEPLLLGE
ncbi:MAG: hypothetical protein J0L92_20270 [Deltaproteobacteria bacterium]|nr:hypothetical protein [Deltaproteobacteria bacterium]